MTRILIILAIAAVVFTVFSVVDCAIQPETRHRGVPKGVWIVIVLVPVIGGLLWFLIGRGREGQVPAGSARPTAPDDDPAFLSSADERIRRLEEELAMLDAEEQFDAEAFDPRAEKPGDEDEGDADDPDDDRRDGRGEA
ncbi:PLD nuclease N-terminal domain-containing protein [Microbacterium sp. gxy059]|uniref:PLD nuclease N-terminal domain-containing protein n=1 Tax=Microbacterium sp. gxy059 TaxID=2957199 RepID=UPI003D965A43